MRNTLLRISTLVVVAVVAAAVSACSKDDLTSNTPVAPSPPPAPTITVVTVTGADAVRTGFFSDYAVSATLSDGTSQNVTSSVTWASSDTARATVEATGRLTGRAHGSTTLTATYQGRTGTKAVNIVNNYGGTWSGSYTPTACDASGAFASISWCRGVVGDGVPLSIVLTQSGNDRSAIAGTLSSGFIRNAPVTGTVTGDGRLILSCDALGTSAGVTFRFQLGGWDTRLTSANSMSGRTAVSFSAVNVSGNAYEEHNITSATLTAPQSTAGLQRE